MEHFIILRIDHSIKQMIFELEVAKKMMKWAVELSEFDNANEP